MQHTLADLFAKQRASVVDWNGAPLYALYEFDDLPDELTVEFLGSTSVPVQGLEFKVRGGLLTVNDVEGDNIVLWRDTAPATVSISARALGRNKAVLRVWNVWRHPSGVTHAWVGDAGMRVDRVDDSVILHCSDGEGPADFHDLEVAIHATN